MNRKQRRAGEKLGREAPSAAPSAQPLSLFARAVAHHQVGRMAEAESLYRQALAVEPNHAETHHYLGVLAWQIGRADIAEAMIGKAIALKGIEPAFHDSLGNALRSLGRLDESVASFRRALTLRPDFFEAYVNLGNALKDQGKLDDCLAAYQRAAALKPDAAIAHSNLGSALKDMGKLSEAEASCRRALTLEPNYAEAHNNLAVALTEQQRFDEAIVSFRQALAFKPDYPSALYNLGNALWKRGALAEAIAAYERALALKPDFAEAHNNLGNALLDQGRLEEATASFERALALKPDYADARSNIGLALADQGKLGEAIDLFEQALARKPDYTDAHSNLLLTQHYSDTISNAERLAAARRFGERFNGRAPARNFGNDRSPTRTLRIGYVSADFRDHPVGYFLTRVLDAHNRSAVEIFCYSNNPKTDATTLRLKGASDHWRAIAGVADAEAAQAIARDGIDILVDLSGHTAKNRLPLFALRPAPVQASWLGYFGTTGLDAIDYLVMDETSVRRDEEQDYCETIVRLPHGRFCYAPPDYTPTPADPPLLTRGYPTFGSFNNLTKIGPEVVRLWAETLRAAPDSRLLLKWKSLNDSATRRRLFDQFAAAGLAPERIELRGFSPHPQMLAQYADIDVALDPFPFGGGLTSCEALWMGVPIVTLPGDRPASRQSKGFLDLVDADDGVASSRADYVRRAVALAADPARLGELRRTLRPRMAASPLCDGALFTPTLEAAFRQMWLRWIAGNGGVATGAPSMVDAA